jgi:tetratricopeptide (TPR) repeat protein
MNNEFPAAEESLNKVLSDSKYKECTEVIRLLAKVKQLQGDKFEAMAHFKRLIELNPSDH